jgi:hypothetical protein
MPSVPNGTWLRLVTPAQAGVHVLIVGKKWIPAYAGMTEMEAFLLN